jgi:hypothetical protein
MMQYHNMVMSGDQNFETYSLLWITFTFVSTDTCTYSYSLDSAIARGAKIEIGRSRILFPVRSDSFLFA